MYGEIYQVLKLLNGYIWGQKKMLKYHQFVQCRILFIVY